MNYLTTILLGLVEGITEFLPISSTGHLILAGHLLNFTGPKAATFEVAIQLGAILAVMVLYWRRFVSLIPISTKPQPFFSGWRGLWLLFLTSLPAALLGLLIHDIIKTQLFNPITVAVALGIGFFQCLSLWPGFSRSAATIMGGMILGSNRKAAAEYSFIAAVPIMIAATGYDLYSSWNLLSSADLPFFAAGLLVSFISAILAIKWFIHIVGRVSLKGFAYYRLALVPLILYLWS